MTNQLHRNISTLIWIDDFSLWLARLIFSLFSLTATSALRTGPTTTQLPPLLPWYVLASCSLCHFLCLAPISSQPNTVPLAGDRRRTDRNGSAVPGSRRRGGVQAAGLARRNVWPHVGACPLRSLHEVHSAARTRRPARSVLRGQGRRARPRFGPRHWWSTGEWSTCSVAISPLMIAVLYSF